MRERRLTARFSLDVTGAPVERPNCIETTAFGAAALAGLAVGFWTGRDEIARVGKIERVFTPVWGETERQKAMAGWHAAVNRVRG